MNKKRVLVTGGAGFVSSVLIGQLLEKGYSVIALDNLYRGTGDSLLSYVSNKNFQFIKEDVLNLKHLYECDAVIAAQSLVGEPICKKYPSLAYAVNSQGTQILATLAGKDNIPIILTSTGSVYGAIGDLCSEDIEPKPISDYAKSKLIAEEYVKSVDGVIYRYATAYGISNFMRLDLLPNSMTLEAVRNKNITVYQANFRRSFIHVRDMASSLIFAIENYDKMKGQIYNCGASDGNVTKQELAEMIAAKTGATITYMDTGYTDSDMRNYEVSNSKLNLLGWSSKISFSDGLNELISAMDLIKEKNMHYYQV